MRKQSLQTMRAEAAKMRATTTSLAKVMRKCLLVAAKEEADADAHLVHANDAVELADLEACARRAQSEVASAEHVCVARHESLVEATSGVREATLTYNAKDEAACRAALTAVRADSDAHPAASGGPADGPASLLPGRDHLHRAAMQATVERDLAHAALLRAEAHLAAAASEVSSSEARKAAAEVELKNSADRLALARRNCGDSEQVLAANVSALKGSRAGLVSSVIEVQLALMHGTAEAILDIAKAHEDSEMQLARGEAELMESLRVGAEAASTECERVLDEKMEYHRAAVKAEAAARVLLDGASDQVEAQQEHASTCCDVDDASGQLSMALMFHSLAKARVEIMTEAASASAKVLQGAKVTASTTTAVTKSQAAAILRKVGATIVCLFVCLKSVVKLLGAGPTSRSMSSVVL